VRTNFSSGFLDRMTVRCELTETAQTPVALAMWNQASAEVILLIRTYAFFNRSSYILVFLVSALAGMLAYQLYVATSQMLRE
jgi:hypothetical protein